MPIARTIARLGAALLGASALPGCYQGIDGAAGGRGDADGSADTADGPGDGSDDGVPDDDGPTACATVATAPLRELTRFEYANTVRDLLGDDHGVADGFVSDAVQGVFARNGGRVVTESLADQYMRAAEELAAATDVMALAGCAEPIVDETACARAFVTSVGTRAFRRPLDAARIDRYVALYHAVRQDGELQADLAGALRVVLEAMLQSPLFLHHIEHGDPSAADDQGRVPLSDYEIASRLSYTVWGSMPDDALFAAAAAGTLSDPDVIEQHARRMLTDDRAKAAALHMYTQWLDLRRIDNAAKSSERFPELDLALRDSMRIETERFLDEVLWGAGNGTVAELFTADFTYVDEGLAALYGIDVGELEPGAWVRVEGLPDARRGLLGHAGFLASHATAEESSPVHRGVFVRDRLMCQPVPLPPDFNPTLPEPLPGETPPELVERHTSDPSCAGCHAFFDPIGLALEHYDGIGRWREEYFAGEPVDAQGEIIGSDDAAIDGRIDALGGLTTALAESAQVRDCVAKQANMFVLGSEASHACVSDEVTQAFASSGGDLRELMIAVVRAESFRMRAADQTTTDAGACP
jgi:hypothetical protein